MLMKCHYCTKEVTAARTASQKLCLLPAAAAAKSLQSCPTLCDPTDGSPPGPAIPGILQARVLEWGAMIGCLHLQLNVMLSPVRG